MQQAQEGDEIQEVAGLAEGLAAIGEGQDTDGNDGIGEGQDTDGNDGVGESETRPPTPELLPEER